MEDTDLVLNKSVTVSDAGVNGGRMSYNQVTSNVLNNMFPNILQSERTSGVDKYRKFFMWNKNSSLETSANSRVWISVRSLGGDYFRIKAGTNIDTQADSSNYTEWLGSGYLTTPFAVDTTTLEVQFDTGDGVYNSSLIRVSDSSGGEEFLTVKSAAGVSWAGSTATITVTSPARRTYPASQNSIVASVVDLSNLIASYDNWVETSAGDGTYDEANYFIVNNVGTVEDSWTLTFVSATTFNVVGTVSGSVGSGISKSSNFSPVNPDVGTGDYFFRIMAAGWAGTWNTADTITFDTHHSAASVWVKEVVPAATSAQANNTFTLKLYGEGS